MQSSFRWLTNFTQSPEGKLWDGDGGGDTGAPADTGTAAPAAQPVSAQPSATVAAPQAPATSAPAVDPSWLKQRLDETRSSATRAAQQQWAQQQSQWQAREQQYQTQLNQIRQQLHALVGVQPPANPELDAIRGQFGKIYPGLSQLESKVEQITQLLERAGDFESQAGHYWQSYGRQTMDRLFNHAQESLGAPLTDEGKRQLHTSFLGYVQSSPELSQRYAEDPTIVEDFWKTFTSSFIDPVRRTQQAQTATRAAAVTNLPQDTPGGAPRQSPAAKPANADERAAQAWALYNQLKK